MDVLTGVLQTSPRLRKIQGAVDHFPRTTPVDDEQGFGQFIDSRMTVRNVDARPNRLFCGISRGIGTQSVVTTTL